MPCSRRNPGSSSNNTVLGTSALPMYHSTYQLEPAVSGFRWMSVDRYWVKILNPDNDLRRSLAFGGRPWKVEVERAEGIEPFSAQRGRLAANLLLARYTWVFPHLSAIDIPGADTLLHRSRLFCLKPPAKHVRCGAWAAGVFLHRGTTGLSSSSYPFRATLAVGPAPFLRQQKTRR